jgi:DNA-binding MarR family transcriptional regulator
MFNEILEIQKPVDLSGIGQRGPEQVVDLGVSEDYLEVLGLAERLHRQFLDVINVELDALGVRDINSVHALILLNIGDAEMTASELQLRGCYMGSNVSYNLKRLTESGYVSQERSKHDRRVIMVRNSPKGLELCVALTAMNARHLAGMLRADLKLEDLDHCRGTLRSLHRFWSQMAQPTRRGPQGQPD